MTRDIEDLFVAEAALRSAARDYHHDSTNVNRKALRCAAREYARMADWFESDAAEPETGP